MRFTEQHDSDYLQHGSFNRKTGYLSCIPAFALGMLLSFSVTAHAQNGDLEPVVPPERRGAIDAERRGTHDANRIRTRFYNYGMVGDFEPDPDLTVFHSAEVPKGSGLNYTDGITPFVLARVKNEDGDYVYIMETGYRERQQESPISDKVMRFEPRPGYFEPDPAINQARSPAISNDPRTWPSSWPNKGPNWDGKWNGYFGQQSLADQESYFVMDDNLYNAWDYYPDRRDSTRRGLGLRIEVRGFQWTNPQARNVIFWHYKIVNESTTDYNDNIIFGLYMDSGVGGSQLSCDGVHESDDDNAFYTTEFGMDLVYTWDKGGHGVGLNSNCMETGYLGYAYLETPGNPFDGKDNDDDGITDEERDSGPGTKIEGKANIKSYMQSNYNMNNFENFYGPLEERPAYQEGVWWTGDENANWVAEFHDTGADGVFGTDDEGERDGKPTAGEPSFDETDLQESDQIGLTGFKYNRIRPGQGNPSQETDNVVFFNDGRQWPQRLYEQFSAESKDERFDPPLTQNYNIGFLFASGPFRLPAGDEQRFSLALGYGSDLTELKKTTQTVQQIYNANYRFAVPPETPVLKAEAKDGKVVLTWNNRAEKSVDPVTNERDFEGYRIYRSTDPNFLDPQVITNARGTGPFGHGKPMAQFDLDNDISGFSDQTVQGTAYYLGENTGITHKYVDSTAVNGMNYYYAVTSYDRGSQDHGFFPSENSISVSRRRRGGTILPENVVEVRPEPRIPGYTPASIVEKSIKHSNGDGSGEVDINVMRSDDVPDQHEFRIEFNSDPDSIRAGSYSLVDATDGELLFQSAEDLSGTGIGPSGSGIQPVINTPPRVSVNTETSGFSTETPLNTKLTARYSDALPNNLRRTGYPEDLVVTFTEEPADTSLASIGTPAKAVKFKITSAESDYQYDFRFRDTDDDGQLSQVGEFIEIVTYSDDQPNSPKSTWSIRPDTTGTGNFTPPQPGDKYKLVARVPFTRDDEYTFTTKGASVDVQSGREDFQETEPYVVPNPYVNAARNEQARFATTGRGERRIEFRNIPANSTIRIYTVSGELVQTLRHTGNSVGMVPWNLRTKDNLELAPGLYIFHVDGGEFGKHIGKFAIMK